MDFVNVRDGSLGCDCANRYPVNKVISLGKSCRKIKQSAISIQLTPRFMLSAASPTRFAALPSKSSLGAVETVPRLVTGF